MNASLNPIYIYVYIRVSPTQARDSHRELIRGILHIIYTLRESRICTNMADLSKHMEVCIYVQEMRIKS